MINKPYYLVYDRFIITGKNTNVAFRYSPLLKKRLADVQISWMESIVGHRTDMMKRYSPNIMYLPSIVDIYTRYLDKYVKTYARKLCIYICKKYIN